MTGDAPPPSGGEGGGGAAVAAHAGGAKVRGRGELLLQVVAIAAVSALFTVLGAGNLRVSVHFGDRATPRLSPPIIAAAAASRSLEPSASHADAGPVLSPSSLSPAPAPSTDSSRSPADAAGTDSQKGRRRERRDKRSQGGTGLGVRGGKVQEGAPAGASAGRSSGTSKIPSLVFIKPHKVAGSTVSGVLRRIGERLGMSGTRDPKWITSEPGVWADHATKFNVRDLRGLKGDRKASYMQKLIGDLKGPRFLVTWVRNPVDRCISNFYFNHVSKGGNREYNEDDIIRFSKRNCRETMADDVALVGGGENAEKILEKYDFVGTVERFDESILLLKHKVNNILQTASSVPGELVQLTLSDILYLRSKDSSSSGAAGAAGFGEPRAHKKMVPAKKFKDLSQRVRDFYTSSEFKDANKVDYALWEGAKQRLDLELEKAGRARIEQEKVELTKLLREINEKCGEFQKNPQDCYYKDYGCGLKCIKSVVEK